MAEPRLSGAQRAILAALTVLLIGGAYFLAKPKPPTAPQAGNTATGTVAAPATSEAELKRYLTKQYGGESSNTTQYALVTRVGQAIVTRSDAKDHKKNWAFHLLTEPNAINMFALPSGDVYVTTALVNRMKTEGQLAAVLSAGVAHVLAGNMMEQLVSGAVQFNVTQESTADPLTVKLMAQAGYDPNAYLGMFQVLTAAFNAHADVPYFASHPSADGRLTAVANAIKALYPKGVPGVLSK